MSHRSTRRSRTSRRATRPRCRREKSCATSRGTASARRRRPPGLPPPSRDRGCCRLPRQDRRRLGRIPGHVHPRGVLPLGRRARRRGHRLPLSCLRVRPAHRRRPVPARPGAAPDLRGARRSGRAPGATGPATCRRRSGPREGGSRLRDRRAGRDDVGAVRRGPRPRRRRPHRPCYLGAGRAVRVAHAAASRGAPLLAAGDRRPRLLGLHAIRRHRADVEGLGHVLVRDRRDVARGPHSGGGRGTQVDARHGPAGAHTRYAPSSTRASRHGS